jgi:anti-sigma factor RsiW
MNEKMAIDENELHAFVDDALDEARLAEVAAIIKGDATLAARVAAYRADKEMLKRVYAQPDARAVPQKWLDLARRSKPQRTTFWRLAGSIAAAIMIGIVGTLVVQSVRPVDRGEIVQAALDARATTTPAEKIVAVENAAGGHRYDATLSAAVALPVKVPDMTKLGFRLIGIRVYSQSAGSGAAELLYKGSRNELFTLYVRRSDGTARFDQFKRNGLRVCVWQDEQLGTVMAGDVSTAAMQRLASLAYTGLTT